MYGLKLPSFHVQTNAFAAMLALRNVSARVSSFNNFVARSLSVVLPSPTKVKRGEGRATRGLFIAWPSWIWFTRETEKCLSRTVHWEHDSFGWSLPFQSLISCDWFLSEIKKNILKQQHLFLTSYLEKNLRGFRAQTNPSQARTGGLCSRPGRTIQLFFFHNYWKDYFSSSPSISWLANASKGETINISRPSRIF